jgi:hypothetical protein
VVFLFLVVPGTGQNGQAVQVAAGVVELALEKSPEFIEVLYCMVFFKEILNICNLISTEAFLHYPIKVVVL